MASSLEIREQFRGRNYELSFAPQGLALSYHGVVSSDPRYQVAPYELVREAHVDQGGRRLTLVFADNRPAWVIAQMNRAEAAWAQVLALEAAERARLYHQ